MIDPSECFAAPVAGAKSMTLVLPRTAYEYRSLIATPSETPVLICLDDYPRLGPFLAFECQQNESWKGLHIPGVRIELDESSLFDGEGYHAPRGAMLRIDDKLALSARFEGQVPAIGGGAIIADGLPPCAPYQSACFLRWQIVLGEGKQKRVLAMIDATAATS